MEKPVKFLNRKNEQLYGIIHIPESNLESKPNGKEGIILAHSGADGRVGYGCQYVHYARRLCQEGFYIFRFDPHGIGDSEGYIASRSWSSLWSIMQTGFYIDDVLAAMDFFIREENIQKITLMGLCAGAVSSLLTAGKDARIDSIILIGMPVLIDDPTIDYQGEISASNYRTSLIKKIISFENWKKFLTLKSDYRKIFRLTTIWLKKEFKKPKENIDINTKAILSIGKPDFNKYILTSFINFVNRKKGILFIYGANDSYFREFKDEFRSKYLLKDDRYNSMYEVYTIEEANHMLTQKKWQDDAIEKILNWLKGDH